jgi:hypothetical protein
MAHQGTQMDPLGNQTPHIPCTLSLRHRTLQPAFQGGGAIRRPRQVRSSFRLPGDDADGVPLEVLAVELEDESLLVIHAMELRRRYQGKYEEAKQWPK